jgi:hypothetical protein
MGDSYQAAQAKAQAYQAAQASRTGNVRKPVSLSAVISNLCPQSGSMFPPRDKVQRFLATAPSYPEEEMEDIADLLVVKLQHKVLEVHGKALCVLEQLFATDGCIFYIRYLAGHSDAMSSLQRLQASDKSQLRTRAEKCIQILLLPREPPASASPSTEPVSSVDVESSVDSEAYSTPDAASEETASFAVPEPSPVPTAPSASEEDPIREQAFREQADVAAELMQATSHLEQARLSVAQLELQVTGLQQRQLELEQIIHASLPIVQPVAIPSTAPEPVAAFDAAAQVIQKGQPVHYIGQNGQPEEAVVVQVDFDGTSEYYYTIRFPSGAERQTTHDRLVLIVVEDQQPTPPALTSGFDFMGDSPNEPAADESPEAGFSFMQADEQPVDAADSSGFSFMDSTEDSTEAVTVAPTEPEGPTGDSADPDPFAAFDDIGDDAAAADLSRRDSCTSETAGGNADVLDAMYKDAGIERTYGSEVSSTLAKEAQEEVQEFNGCLEGMEQATQQIELELANSIPSSQPGGRGHTDLLCELSTALEELQAALVQSKLGQAISDAGSMPGDRQVLMTHQRDLSARQATLQSRIAGAVMKATIAKVQTPQMAPAQGTNLPGADGGLLQAFAPQASNLPEQNWVRPVQEAASSSSFSFLNSSEENAQLQANEQARQVQERQLAEEEKAKEVATVEAARQSTLNEKFGSLVDMMK